MSYTLFVLASGSFYTHISRADVDALVAQHIGSSGVVVLLTQGKAWVLSLLSPEHAQARRELGLSMRSHNGVSWSSEPVQGSAYKALQSKTRALYKALLEQTEQAVSAQTSLSEVQANRLTGGTAYPLGEDDDGVGVTDPVWIEQEEEEPADLYA